MPFSIAAFVGRLDKAISANETNRAEVCRNAGINHSSIDSWARGSIPSVEKAVRVAEALKIPIGWLLTENDGISQEERDLLAVFRQLDDPKDRGEIKDIIEVKIKNAKKGAISSSSGNA
jgi:transcriptional regulator with XRE-family HTH domain